jgi:DNA mismatch endonuclease, patch repair protein
MTDIVDQETRSRMMSSIGGKNTKPELLLRSYLHSKGMRFRLHRKDLPGKPDIVLPRYRSAIFVNGCYWHRHQGCHYASTPSTNSDFWEEKFRQTLHRDQRQQSELTSSGWRVLVVWECGLKHSSYRLDQVCDLVRGRYDVMEWPAVPPRPCEKNNCAS